MKKTTLLIILSLILAGCTATSTSMTGEELSVDLYSDTEEPQPKDTITITASVTNPGGSSASNVYAELLNTAGLNVEEERRRMFTTDTIREGDTDEVSWTIRIPEAQMKTSYAPFARICYEYNTTGYQDLFITGREWEGDAPQLYSDSSEAPLSMGFEARTQYKGQKTNTYAKIVLTNTGGGEVYNNTAKLTQYNLDDYDNGEIGVVGSVKLTIPKGEGVISIIDSEPSICEGNPTPCNNIIEGSPCTTQLGCAWDNGGADNAGTCSGSAESCELLERAECTSQSGCDWFNSPETNAGAFVCEERTGSYECTATQESLKLVNDEERSLRINFNTNPEGKGQQSLRMNAQAVYRYCIKSDELEISVEPYT